MRKFAIFAALAIAAGCGSAQSSSYDAYNLANQAENPPRQAASFSDSSTSSDGDVAYAVETMSASSDGARRAERSRGSRRGDVPMEPTAARATPPPAPRAGMPGEADTAVASNEEAPPLDRDAERSLPLLIYTGTVQLAIYDVDEMKEAAIALIETAGGYAAERTDQYLVLRVPAERFRTTLDALGELGDVLSLTWDAADVTDQFNDIEVRIRNARQMRERLEALLLVAENVPDALAIERELERVTLDIERLEGQRRQMADRIAFSTITVYFSRIATSAVPGDEYRLPFGWLNQLGVERLLSL